MKIDPSQGLGDAQVLSALPAFEAAARLGSLTRAARELGVTQSALSRRITTLERGLGVALFSRRGRTIAITGDGLRLAEAAGEAMRLIERMRGDLGGSIAGSIRVGALPSIGGLWLAPRLPSFLAAYPAVAVSMVTIDADFADAHKDPVNWDPSTVDVVLTWGRGGWRSLSVRRLAKERMVPVCSPGFAEAHGLERAANFWRSPRLAHTTRGDAWRAYAQATGAEIPGDAPPVRLELEHFFMLLEAARAGTGLALLPDLFVAADLASGRLVALAPAWATGAVYAAVASPSALARPVVAAFVDWLDEQAADAEVLLHG